MTTLDDLRFVDFDIDIEEIEAFEVASGEKAIDVVTIDFLNLAFIWFILLEIRLSGSVSLVSLFEKQ